MRLRGHLLTLVLAALVPVLLFSFVMVVIFWRQERAAVERGMRETVRALVVAIDRELESSITAMSALATTRTLDSGNLREFSRQAARLGANRSTWQSIALVNRSGAQLLDTLTPFGTALPSVAEREYFRQVIATGRPAISNALVASVPTNRIVVIAVPILREGRLVYVLLASLDARHFEKILHQQKIPTGWLAGILDRRKILVARTSNAERFVGRPGPALLAEQTREMDEGWLRHDTGEGTEVYTAFARSPLSGWTVTLGVPAGVVDGSLQRSLGTVVGFGVLFLVLGVALALRFGARIAESIGALSRAAGVLGHGGVPPRVDSSVDEIAGVARALEDAGGLLCERAQERETATAAARESEERLRFALEAAHVGAWDWDIASGAITWSFQLDALHGLPPGLSGNELYEACRHRVHPQDTEAMRAAVVRAFKEGGEQHIEYRVLLDGGETRWIHAKGRVLQNAAGRAVRMSGVCFDVSERRRSDEERTRLLAAEQAARAEAERANRAKDEFLATLSHELRTPLNALMGWARMLRTSGLDTATVARAVDVIERNTRVQAQLVADLLDVSRIITGKLRLDLRPVRLVRVTEAALDAVRGAADAKQIRLETRFDPTVGIVMGDADRLQQIVWNLLSNAVKFTPAGGRITVEVRCTDGAAELHVTDTGRGISAEFLPYVFDRFRQADSTTTRAHGGLGLGLAIVRHLVELHGGTVQASSPGEGAGATFTVRLPLARMDVADAVGVVAAAESLSGGDSFPPLDGVRVLLVDDEADTREVITEALGKCGAVVAVAASAGEALALLDLAQPDVLVSDIAMPDMDGYALLEKIRLHDADQGRWLPAVALTAYARTEDRDRALAAGYQFHVPKPVDPVALARAVASLAVRLRRV
jgi:signal transduction histidine kinase